MATIPTTHTNRNDDMMAASGEKKILAIEEIGMAEVLIAIGSEVCRMEIDAHQPATAKVRTGIPTESLNRRVESKQTIGPPWDVLSTLYFSLDSGQFPL